MIVRNNLLEMHLKLLQVVIGTKVPVEITKISKTSPHNSSGTVTSETEIDLRVNLLKKKAI